MREYTEVMADEMAVEHVEDTCGQVQDTCVDTVEDWSYQIPLSVLPKDVELIHTAVVKHNVVLERGDEAYKYLVRRLRIGTETERELAMDVLGHVDDEDAWRELHEAFLREKNPKLRERALDIAYQSFGVKALATVCEALMDRRASIRYNAQCMLMNLYKGADLATREQIFRYLVLHCGRLFNLLIDHYHLRERLYIPPIAE